MSAAIGAANRKLNNGIEETSKATRRNGDEARAQSLRMKESVRDLLLSEVALSGFYMTLSMPDASPPQQTPDLRKAKQEGDAILEGLQRAACKKEEPGEGGLNPDRPCDKAYLARKSWRETFEFFNHLDPMGHLKLDITFNLTNFLVGIYVSDQSDGVHGPTLSLLGTPDVTPQREDMWLGGSPAGNPMEISFGREKKNELKSKTSLSRDLDRVSFGAPFQIKICDVREKTEDAGTIKRHLALFPANQQFKLTVIGFEKTERSMPDVIRKDYLLEPTTEQLNPIAPFVEDNCMVVEYH